MDADFWLGLTIVGIVVALIASILVCLTSSVWLGIATFFGVWFLFLGPHPYILYLDKKEGPWE